MPDISFLKPPSEKCLVIIEVSFMAGKFHFSWFDKKEFLGIERWI
jgi:hypothetical protein